MYTVVSKDKSTIAAPAQHPIDEDDDYETILIYRSYPNPIEMAERKH